MLKNGITRVFNFLTFNYMIKDFCLIPKAVSDITQHMGRFLIGDLFGTEVSLESYYACKALGQPGVT